MKNIFSHLTKPGQTSQLKRPATKYLFFGALTIFMVRQIHGWATEFNELSDGVQLPAYEQAEIKNTVDPNLVMHGILSISQI